MQSEQHIGEGAQAEAELLVQNWLDAQEKEQEIIDRQGGDWWTVEPGTDDHRLLHETYRQKIVAGAALLANHDAVAIACSKGHALRIAQSFSRHSTDDRLDRHEGELIKVSHHRHKLHQALLAGDLPAIHRHSFAVGAVEFATMLPRGELWPMLPLGFEADTVDAQPQILDGYEIRQDVAPGVVMATVSHRHFKLLIGGGVLDRLGWKDTHPRLTLLHDEIDVAPCIIPDPKGVHGWSKGNENGFGLRPPVEVTFYADEALAKSLERIGVGETESPLIYRFTPGGEGLILDLSPPPEDLTLPAAPAQSLEDRHSLPRPPKLSFFKTMGQESVLALAGFIIFVLVCLLISGGSRREDGMTWQAYEQTTAIRDLDRSIRQMDDSVKSFNRSHYTLPVGQIGEAESPQREYFPAQQEADPQAVREPLQLQTDQVKSSNQPQNPNSH